MGSTIRWIIIFSEKIRGNTSESEGSVSMDSTVGATQMLGTKLIINVPEVF